MYFIMELLTDIGRIKCIVIPDDIIELWIPHMFGCPQMFRSPHMFGHPHMYGCPPDVWMTHMFGQPHMFGDLPYV